MTLIACVLAVNFWGGSASFQPQQIGLFALQAAVSAAIPPVPLIDIVAPPVDKETDKKKLLGENALRVLRAVPPRVAV